MKMPKDFPYDIIKLIHAVKDRPSLWDKSSKSYKDRVERKLAWEEVFNLLEPHYEEISSKEKKNTEKQIMTKWTNLRDRFVKTLKNKQRNPTQKYIYHDELHFLLKCEPNHIQNSDETGYSSTDNSVTNSTSVPIKCEEDAEKKSTSIRYNTRKRTKKRNSCDNSDFNFIEVDEGNHPSVMNEDEAFFASLLPSIVKYTEDERLEFRLEVLALMKRIKDNRNLTNPL